MNCCIDQSKREILRCSLSAREAGVTKGLSVALRSWPSLQSLARLLGEQVEDLGL